MHIRRVAVTPFRGWAEGRGPGHGGVRPGVAFAVAAALGIALTLWLAALQLGPGAPCLDDPGGVCEPF